MLTFVAEPRSAEAVGAEKKVSFTPSPTKMTEAIAMMGCARMVILWLSRPGMSQHAIEILDRPNGSRMMPSKGHRLDKGEERCGQKRSPWICLSPSGNLYGFCRELQISNPVASWLGSSGDNDSDAVASH
jgi:hypothetical protein